MIEVRLSQGRLTNSEQRRLEELHLLLRSPNTYDVVSKVDKFRDVLKEVKLKQIELTPEDLDEVFD